MRERRAARSGQAQYVVRRRVAERIVELTPLFALIPALLLVIALILVAGANPFEALRVLLDASLGDATALGVTAVKFVPLLVTALGVGIGVRAGLWNLGGEGQIYIGGLFASVVAIFLVPGLSGPAQILLALLGGFLGGALWMLFPALLRTTRGVTELITTLLMNFIAINLVTILVQGALGEEGASFPRSPPIPDGARLPLLAERTQLHSGLIVALVLAAVVHVLMSRTTFGFETRAIGEGEKASLFAGIAVRRRVFQALLLSGGLAGVAGAIEILGVHFRLTQGFSPGFGFDAIAIALLGAADPRGMIPAAFLFAVLRAGAPAMERSVDVPSDLVFITQGIAILAVVAGYGLRTELRRRLAGRRTRDQAKELEADAAP
jgi:ABC-type uncharacterized transport system permease subunit